MIKVTHIEEHKDGSATLSLEMTEEALALLVQAGLIKALEDTINHEEERTT